MDSLLAAGPALAEALGHALIGLGLIRFSHAKSRVAKACRSRLGDACCISRSLKLCLVSAWQALQACDDLLNMYVFSYLDFWAAFVC